MPSVPPKHITIPTLHIRGRRVWRCVPRAFAKTALESGPSFTKDRRYSVQGEFGAIYLSGAKELSELESDTRGGEDVEPLAYLAFELTVDKIVDLTAPKIRHKLGVKLEDLVKPRIAGDRYEVTQALARQVYANRLNGILAPSLHDSNREKPDWFNIILYPAHLLSVYLRPLG